jgi:Zn-finger nucleic acid-binding protein
MSLNRYDFCKYCQAEMPKRKNKRYRFTMCRDCQMQKKDGNPKLKKIFDELRDNPAEYEEEDWGADNVQDNDNTPYKKKGHTEVWRRTTLDDI